MEYVYDNKFRKQKGVRPNDAAKPDPADGFL